MKKVAIIGSAKNGGAAQIIEIASRSSIPYSFVIFDRDKSLIGYKVFDVEVTGTSEQVFEYWENDKFDAAIIAIGGDLIERKQIFDRLVGNGVPFVNIIDKNVVFGINYNLGVGNVIMNNSYFGNNVQIGNNNYFLNNISIQHDSKVGSSNYFSTGTTLGAHCEVGDSIRFEINEILKTRNIKI